MRARGRALDDVLQPGHGPLAYRTRDEVELVPFHRIAHERYSLYWKTS